MPKTENGTSSKYSELRQDIVSGDWVVIATGRARRPNDFAAPPKSANQETSRETCPFEKLEEDALLIVTRDGGKFAGLAEAGSGAQNWFIEVIPNKFPAFTPRPICPSVAVHGLHRMIEGIGFHEVIVTNPHDRPIPLMSTEEVRLVAEAYRERFRALGAEPCVQYVSIIHNHGPASGASIVHPHSQLIAIPVIPPDVSRSLMGSARYFRENKSCVHCAMLEMEIKEQSRVVFENGHFVVYAPYASRAAFEIRIFPKRHDAKFESIKEDEITAFAEALKRSLTMLYYGLGDPSYNFFLHTAPTDGRDYMYYHWHLEILPKTSTWGGFEFGTGIEISTITPEDAAKFLRGVEIPETS